MATRFVSVDRNTPLLLPPDLRDWVPADHLAHFVIDAVEAIDLREVQVNTRGTGDAQYPPMFGHPAGQLVDAWKDRLKDGRPTVKTEQDFLAAARVSSSETPSMIDA